MNLSYLLMGICTEISFCFYFPSLFIQHTGFPQLNVLNLNTAPLTKINMIKWDNGCRLREKTEERVFCVFVLLHHQITPENAHLNQNNTENINFPFILFF